MIKGEYEKGQSIIKPYTWRPLKERLSQLCSARKKYI